MDSLRPLLLLDVDGVLAPIGRPQDETLGDWHRLPPGPTWLPHAVVGELKALVATDLWEPMWLTSWQEEALLVGEALGLPAWPAHGKGSTPRWYEVEGGSDWWKERVVRSYLEVGRAVVWCEDGIPWQADPHLSQHYEDMLLPVAPDPGVGLTPGDFLRIRRWASDRR